MQIVDDKEKKESASSKKPSNVKAEDASRRGVGINISAISSYFPATEFKVTSAQEIKSSSRSDQSR